MVVVVLQTIPRPGKVDTTKKGANNGMVEGKKQCSLARFRPTATKSSWRTKIIGQKQRDVD